METKEKTVIRYLTATNTFKYLGVKKDFFYTTLLKDPTFPKPLYLTAKKRVWDKLSLDNWLQARQIVSDLQTKEVLAIGK